MALRGKHNVIQLVRINKAPYWRIYQNESKRQAGNYIDQADFTDANLDLENSISRLTSSLETLTTGTYLFVAFTSKDKSKGGIDTNIEIDGIGAPSAINGTGPGAGEFFLEGIGKVTAENFEAAIETKMRKMQEKLQAEQELRKLKEENARLKRDLLEFEGGFKKGLLSVGSIAYDYMKDTPSGKEFIGMAQKIMLNMNGRPAGNTPAIAAKQAVNGTEELSTDDDRLAVAIEGLADGNPDWLGQLEKLAKLKKDDPSTFEMAVDSLNTTPQNNE